MITLSTSGLIVLLVTGYLGINSVVTGIRKAVRNGERQSKKNEEDKTE